MLGSINDFCSLNDKLYIYDFGMKAVWVYNLDGTLNKKILLNIGEGPGEINKEVISMGVSEKLYRLWVTALLKKYLFFNSTMEVSLTRIKITFSHTVVHR